MFCDTTTRSMKLSKTDNILFCSNNADDLDYVRDVAEMVFARYDEASSPRQLGKPLWMISTGGRAGVFGVTLGERTCCIKLFHDRRMQTRLRTWLGFAKGRRAYINGLHLARLGLACPQMWGYAERRPDGPALLITELVTCGQRLDLWAQKHTLERSVVTTLAQFIRNMHNRGVSHIDLSARNILICQNGSDLEFLLLDYEDARFARKVSRRTRLNNLHHLHERVFDYVPLRKRLQFLHVYAEQDYRAYRDALRSMLEKRR